MRQSKRPTMEILGIDISNKEFPLHLTTEAWTISSRVYKHVIVTLKVIDCGLDVISDKDEPITTSAWSWL